MSQPGDYDAVRRDIVAQLKKPGYDDGSAGPVFVRLAWYVPLSLLFSPYRRVLSVDGRWSKDGKPQTGGDTNKTRQDN